MSPCSTSCFTPHWGTQLGTPPPTLSWPLPAQTHAACPGSQPEGTAPAGLGGSEPSLASLEVASSLSRGLPCGSWRLAWPVLEAAWLLQALALSGAASSVTASSMPRPPRLQHPHQFQATARTQHTRDKSARPLALRENKPRANREATEDRWEPMPPPAPLVHKATSPHRVEQSLSRGHTFKATKASVCPWAVPQRIPVHLLPDTTHSTAHITQTRP